jgi:hypothetical protein
MYQATRGVVNFYYAGVLPPDCMYVGLAHYSKDTLIILRSLHTACIIKNYKGKQFIIHFILFCEHYINKVFEMH